MLVDIVVDRRSLDEFDASIGAMFIKRWTLLVAVGAANNAHDRVQSGRWIRINMRME